ncbi:hypothetical protein MAF45_08865 [Mesosutterella sp. OilRF-GAM-744-9]|uniref:Uncharacterized protein n=1 Tax=Mesosutterella porci TaxID=2915351 RepID=A0ABS9MT35_9BURK|nr:hypothetical protein [Mesosutterella sp. oilRF-744-WT-GAM-9]
MRQIRLVHVAGDAQPRPRGDPLEELGKLHRPFSALPTSGGCFWGGFNPGISNMAIPTGTYGQGRIYFTCIKPEAEKSAAAPAEQKMKKIFACEDHDTYFIPELTEKRVRCSDSSVVYQVAVARNFSRRQDSGAMGALQSYVLGCSNGLMLPLETRFFEEHVPSSKLISREIFSATHHPAPSLLENAVKNPELTPIYLELCR